MRLSRHQLWSGSSYDGAACRPRRCPVQVVPSDQPQLCGSVKLVPMADLSALPSCSTSPWRQTLERPRKNSHHARSTRTPTHTSPAGSSVSSSKFQFSTFSVQRERHNAYSLPRISAENLRRKFNVNLGDKPNKLKLRFPVESTL